MLNLEISDIRFKHPCEQTEVSMRKILTVALLLSGAAHALTLEEVTLQLPRAPGGVSAELTYQNSVASLLSARAAQGLSANVGGDFSLNTDFANQSNSSGTLSTSLSSNVLPWSAAAAGVRSSERALQRATLDRQDSLNAALLGIYGQLSSLKNAELDLDYAGAQQALSAAQLEAARAQREQGNLSAEGLQTRTNALESAQNSVSSALGALNIAQLSLSQSLGLAVSGPSNFQVPEISAPPALEVALKTAFVKRSEILKAQNQLEVAQDAVKAAELNRWLPSASLSAQYGQIGSSSGGSAGGSLSAGLNFKTGAASLGASLPLKSSSTPTSLSLGISLGFNLLDPAADASLSSAQLGVSSAQFQLENAKRTVELDVRQKYADFDSAQNAVTLARATLDLNQTTLESAQSREKAGLATALETLGAQLNVLSAQKSLEAARGSAWIARLKLEVALGTFKPLG